MFFQRHCYRRACLSFDQSTVPKQCSVIQKLKEKASIICLMPKKNIFQGTNSFQIIVFFLSFLSLSNFFINKRNYSISIYFLCNWTINIKKKISFDVRKVAWIAHSQSLANCSFLDKTSFPEKRLLYRDGKSEKQFPDEK